MRQHVRTGSTARAVALVCSLVLALAVLPGAALAGPPGTTGDVVVGANETVTDDVTAMTGDVVVRGTVEGDVSSVAGSVRITGTVTGDVSAAAGSVTLDGTVEGDVSAAADSVDVRAGSRVGGDVSAGGGSVDVGPGATVDGSTSAGGGSVTVARDATVHEDVSAGGGDAEIAGSVGDDVRSGETVVLESTADVGGDVVYRDSIDRADGATVDGSVTQRSETDWSALPGIVHLDGGNGGSSITLVPDVVPDRWSGLYWAGFALLVGGVALLLFPEFSADVAARVGTDPLRATAAGFLTIVAVPLFLLGFAVTIIGIPVAVAGGALFGLAAWIGYVYGLYLLGRQVLEALGASSRWVALVVGVVGVTALSFVPLFGDLLRVAVLIVGLGAIVLVAVERWREESDDPGGPADADDAADRTETDGTQGVA